MATAVTEANRNGHGRSAADYKVRACGAAEGSGVPELTMNLVSVAKVSEKASVFFKGSECTIKAGSCILKAVKADGLYRLRAQSTTVNHALVSARRPKETPELWHARYGHLSYAALHQMAKKDMVNGRHLDADDCRRASEKVCEPCVMASLQRDPFGVQIR